MGEFSDKQKKYLKDLLGDLNSSLNNKIHQLETSITAKLEDVRSEFEEKVRIYEGRIKELEHINGKLRKELNFIDKKQKKNKLVVHGLDPEVGNIEEKVIDIARNSLQVELNSSDINDIYKVGKGAKKPVIVELISYRKKCQILKGANKLKGTSIFLSPDLSPEERAQHKMLVNHMNEARNRGKQAKIQGKTLIIEGQTITIQQLEKQKTADEPKNFSENLIHPGNKGRGPVTRSTLK
ncbi:hypothetical protein HHI36_005522 [Cryptolaemus montrouzieri]|uniref:Endonuclease-reverse transcriptase n=1 Tax=Cryptolaemus montrouzieri TaxID=559131 RepID=A0ABD2NVZ8_9CUCU